MAIVQWDESMSVGVAELDAQHKRLIDIINELGLAIGVGKGRNCLVKSIRELADYTEYHFSLEHEYFHRFGFSETEAHMKQHIEFVTHVQNTADKVKSGKTVLTINTLFFLKDWLVNHIMGSDKQYARLLKDNGVS